jgi:hypothetical protein
VHSMVVCWLGVQSSLLGLPDLIILVWSIYKVVCWGYKIIQDIIYLVYNTTTPNKLNGVTYKTLR